MNNDQSLARITAVTTLALLCAGCADELEEYQENQIAFPPSLSPSGKGIPTEGAPCRALEPSAAIDRWQQLDAKLVGCPTRQDANALDGRAVGIVDGFIIVATQEVLTTANESSSD